MAKKEIMIVADYSHETSLSLEEVCEICAISADFMQDLISYDIVHRDGRPAEWRFNINELRRIKTALRLQRDLEVNLAGVALVLDLLDQLKEIETKMTLVEKHFRF